MNPLSSKPSVPLLFSLVAVLAGALSACSVDSNDEATSSTASPLMRGGPGTIRTPVVGPGGGGYAPVVSAPQALIVGTPTAAWATSPPAVAVPVHWLEVATPVNQETVLYRQQYDVTGTTATTTAIKTFSNLPAGLVQFTDEASQTADHSSPLPNTQVCYYVEEFWGGACNVNPQVPSCVSSATVCTTTSDTKPVDAHILQLRVVVAPDATAEGVLDHVTARLSPNNVTWLGSSGTPTPDFTAGSDITYDLMTAGIHDRSDIQYLSIQTDDSNSICISEVQLLVDNVVTFTKSYGAECQWVWESTAVNGSEVFVPFSELRSSPQWQGLTLPDLTTAGTGHPFLGYDSSALVQLLDAQLSNALRNPSTGAGDDAELIAPTSLYRVDTSTLSVTQHVGGLSLEGYILGDISADVNYDLVLASGPACAPANYCINVVNANIDASYLGLGDILPEILLAAPLAMDAAFEYFESGTLTSVPLPFPLCFTGPTSQTLGSYAIGVPFDPNSVTICTMQ